MCEDELADDAADNPHVQKVRAMAEEEGSGVFVICAQIEQEIAELDDDEKALVIKEIVDYSYNKAKADLLDIDMSEVSGYKTVTKKLKGGMALYDYYAQEIYKNR